MWEPARGPELTFLFQKHAALGHNNGHITIDVALAFFVKEADGDIGVSNTGLEWHAENALGCHCAVVVRTSLIRERTASKQASVDRTSNQTHMRYIRRVRGNTSRL